MFTNYVLCHIRDLVTGELFLLKVYNNLLTMQLFNELILKYYNLSSLTELISSRECRVLPSVCIYCI
jgi:hypothetical protein